MFARGSKVITHNNCAHGEGEPRGEPMLILHVHVHVRDRTRQGNTVHVGVICDFNYNE